MKRGLIGKCNITCHAKLGDFAAPGKGSFGLRYTAQQQTLDNPLLISLVYAMILPEQAMGKTPAMRLCALCQKPKTPED